MVIKLKKFSSSSQQSVFLQHCRKISEQLQRSKPTWERKVVENELIGIEILLFRYSIYIDDRSPTFT